MLPIVDAKFRSPAVEVISTPSLPLITTAPDEVAVKSRAADSDTSAKHVVLSPPHTPQASEKTPWSQPIASCVQLVPFPPQTPHRSKTCVLLITISHPIAVVNSTPAYPEARTVPLVELRPMSPAEVTFTPVSPVKETVELIDSRRRSCSDRSETASVVDSKATAPTATTLMPLVAPPAWI